MKRIIFTLAMCLALLSACNENSKYIGDYYYSKQLYPFPGQLYPELANLEFRNEIVLSINKDGTGFANYSFRPNNAYSGKNSGKFTWFIKKEPMSGKRLIIKWENGGSNHGMLMKVEGKNILYLVVYDSDIKNYKLQIVGEKK